MQTSFMSTDRLQERRAEVVRLESYGKSIDGQRLLEAIDKELKRREQARHVCGEVCGDCTGCGPVNLCLHCTRRGRDCPIGGERALECVEFRPAWG